VIIARQPIIFLFEFAALEAVDFFEPGERILELFAGGFLIVTGSNDFFLEQIALIDSDFFPGRIIGAAATAADKQANQNRGDGRHSHERWQIYAKTGSMQLRTGGFLQGVKAKAKGKHHRWTGMNTDFTEANKGNKEA